MDKYFKERILAAAYKLAHGIIYEVALDLSGLNLDSQWLYAKKVFYDDTDNYELLVIRDNKHIVLKDIDGTDITVY